MLGSSVYWMWGEPAIKTANFNPLKWASLESGKEENVFRHSGRRKNPFLLSVPFTHRKFSEVIATFCCNSRRSFACIIKIVIFQYVVITFTITDYYLPKNKCFTINSWTSKWFVNSKNFWVEVSSLLLRNERCQLCSVMAEIHCNSFLSSFFSFARCV